MSDYVIPADAVRAVGRFGRDGAFGYQAVPPYAYYAPLRETRVAAEADARWIGDDRRPAFLVLDDGTEYAGYVLLDEEGRPVVRTAECGECGFTWNDAMVTSLTPTPAGRCPNERCHDDPDDEAGADPVESISGTIAMSDGTTSSFCITPGITDAGWQQWGANMERLGRTSGLLEALTDAARGYLQGDES